MSIAEERIIALALEHLENQKRAIDAEIAELREKLRSPGITKRGRQPHRRIFAETTTEQQHRAGARKPKRRMSEAQRAAISEKLKERWAERKRHASAGQSSARDPEKMKPILVKKARSSDNT